MRTTRDRMDLAAAALSLVAAAVLGVLAVVDGRWWLLLATAALVFGGVQQLRQVRAAPARRRVSAEAAAAWTPERVREVVGDAGDDVQAVRAVRRADPALTLVDAVAVVRTVRPAPPGGSH